MREDSKNAAGYGVFNKVGGKSRIIRGWDESDQQHSEGI
jgi:hypothetical protein